MKIRMGRLLLGVMLVLEREGGDGDYSGGI